MAGQRQYDIEGVLEIEHVDFQIEWKNLGSLEECDSSRDVDD